MLLQFMYERNFFFRVTIQISTFKDGEIVGDRVFRPDGFSDAKPGSSVRVQSQVDRLISQPRCADISVTRVVKYSKVR